MENFPSIVPGSEVAHLADALRAEDQRQAAARAAAGRYTLWDAAEEIARATSAPRDIVLKSLVVAAEATELRVCPPGEAFPRTDLAPGLVTFSDEATAVELNAWLDRIRVASSWRFPETLTAPPPRPKGVFRQQEEQILQKLRQLGYDPNALPPAGGKHGRGAKSAVRDALRWEGRIFDKAWDRLRGNKHIRDA